MSTQLQDIIIMMLPLPSQPDTQLPPPMSPRNQLSSFPSRTWHKTSQLSIKPQLVTIYAFYALYAYIKIDYLHIEYFFYNSHRVKSSLLSLELSFRSLLQGRQTSK